MMTVFCKRPPVLPKKQPTTFVVDVGRCAANNEGDLVMCDEISFKIATAHFGHTVTPVCKI